MTYVKTQLPTLKTHVVNLKRDAKDLSRDLQRLEVRGKLGSKTLCLRQTAKVNLYHVTKFSPYLSFTVHCFYTKISSFMPVLSKRIVLDCFYLLVFYSDEKMSICSSTPQHGGYTDSSLLEGDVKVRKCHVMLFSRACMSRKWM